MAIKNVQLPELGEGVNEGELVKWLVKPGDRIKQDQAIAEMMTDKATVEVPSPSAGTVKEIKFKEGDVVAVGNVMITLETEGAAGASAGATAAPTKAPAAPTPTAAPAAAKGGGGAMKNVQLPELGEGVNEGELVKWLVKPGDRIKQDQAIAEMMTDKATVEVPSPSAGTVKEIKFKEGDVVAVGNVMITLETDGAATTTSAAPAKAQTPAPAASRPAAAPSATSARPAMQMSAINGMDVYPPPAGSKVLATPATRRLAREMGLDINGMQGTGIAGRVTRDDVMGARGAGAVSAGAPSVAARGGAQTPSIPRPAYQGVAGAAEERVALRGIRKKIAENMQMAKHVIPHFTIMDEANVTQLVALREELKNTSEKTGVKITYMPFIFKALIATIREFPMFNASIDDAAQEIVYKKYFNVGFAADTPNGLLVPVVKNADQKTLVQVARDISDLGKKARDGKLALDEMKGATFTVTNIGSVGGTYATPVINHPEVFIFGMYKIQDKPVPTEGGGFKFVKTMNFTVTADHRLIDGAVAARFLKAFIERIENPGVLMLDMM